MEITLTTPSLLFPAITLLLLAYTNRSIAIATLVRSLHAKYLEKKAPLIAKQIKTLKVRIVLIRAMQECGILSLLSCVLCMLLLFGDMKLAGEIVFGISLLLMIGSLVLSFIEVQISVRALNIELSDMSEQLLD